MSKSSDLPDAADLLRPLITGTDASRDAKILYADILNHLSHAQPKEQGIEMCEEAREVLAGIGALALEDLTAASVYADTADSQARHALSLGRLEDAEKLEQQVYEIAERVLLKRPADIRSMKNRSLAADLLGRIAMRNQDFQTASTYLARAEIAGEDIVRFNPGDLSSWVYWIRSGGLTAFNLVQQGRVSEAIAKSQSMVDLAKDDRLTASLMPGLEGMFYRLADWQMEFGRSAAAERSFASGVKATEEVAAQQPADSERHAIAIIRPVQEQAQLSLAAGSYAVAFEQASAVVRRLDEFASSADRYVVLWIDDLLHGALETVSSAGMRLGKFAEAEAAARRHDALEPGSNEDPQLHRARRQVEVAQALVGQGRRDEARAELEPALALLRDRTKSGAMGLDLRRDYAAALYVQALAQDDGPAGRAVRAKALAEASTVLGGLSPEARQLRFVRVLSDDISAARQAPGG
jgi:tetratricopeptide (TPR) repeat protein